MKGTVEEGQGTQKGFYMGTIHRDCTYMKGTVHWDSTKGSVRVQYIHLRVHGDMGTVLVHE